MNDLTTNLEELLEDYPSQIAETLGISKDDLKIVKHEDKIRITILKTEKMINEEQIKRLMETDPIIESVRIQKGQVDLMTRQERRFRREDGEIRTSTFSEADGTGDENDFFETVKLNLVLFDFSEFADDFLRENILSLIRDTAEHELQQYSHNDFEHKTSLFKRLLSEYRIYKLVKRFCEENHLNGYISESIIYPDEFETVHNRLFPDDKNIKLARNSTNLEPSEIVSATETTQKPHRKEVSDKQHKLRSLIKEIGNDIKTKKSLTKKIAIANELHTYKAYKHLSVDTLRKYYSEFYFWRGKEYK
ncbi:MAG: hypothetical protein COT43_06965 [Candidatus Marinimicrobia bacterium CG08_land_8_20_14_0_20_45_22]|nr:MAG: hypothetical protein COT43_06965 [Candidatus Marinimicrobia bacterium CG08_land_8_20_14_0_20_45_22]